MGSANHLELGQNNVICDRCGVKRKSNQVTQTWDRLIVCSPTIKSGCFEHRHPQDFVRSIKDDQAPVISRPEGTDTFVGPTYIDESIGHQENTKPTGTFDNSL